MIFEGCQGKPRTPTLEEKRCPRCGSLIEIFSVDTEAVCEKCGQVIYNDALSCVQWQKARAQAEREARKQAKQKEALNA